MIDDIIKTKKGDYKIINVTPSGIGTMISMKKVINEGVTGDYALFQVYNHREKPEILSFTGEVWMKPYIARYLKRK